MPARGLSDAETRPLAPLRRIGPYRLEERIGAGGMGEVYRALDERLLRRVALKQVRPEATKNPRARRRFWREARATARLNHPGIVRIYDVLGAEDGDWIVMELVEGPTLARLLDAGAIPLPGALPIAAEIAEALAAAHAAGIVHQDLKPSNVIVTREGHAKILDFGVAKLIPGCAGDSTSVSADGRQAGTPHAMSPEQALGRRVDQRSDLFSLGSLLYHMVTGTQPFFGPTPRETIERICAFCQRPARQLVPEVPEALSDLLDRLLEKDPLHRPEGATEVGEELRRIADGAPGTGRALSPGAETTTITSWAAGDERRGPVDQAAFLEPVAWEDGPVQLTPLIARERELDLLYSRWQLVLEGSGQVILISGEAGIGKSRLVRSLKERLDPRRWLSFYGAPYTKNSPLLPVAGLLRRLLDDDAFSGRLPGLVELLEKYKLPPEETVPLLAPLLELPHEERFPSPCLPSDARREATFEALAALVMNMAEDQPLVLAVEDLHWVDPTTLELLGLLIDRATASPIFLVMTCRPHFSSPWHLRRRPTQINLSQLTATEAEQLVGQVAAGETLPAEVRAQIVARTDGVPLFVEELTKSVLESGQPAGEPRIPATLRDSLAARLDRLGAAQRVAQLAAVLGRSFSYELLSAIAPLAQADLEERLEKLVQAELVYRKGFAPRRQFTFKHALIQEVAYGSLLRKERLEIHRSVARYLESHSSETIKKHPELLAHHQTEGGLWNQAAETWYEAGKNAQERSAFEEAVSHLRKGLALLEKLPPLPERRRRELEMLLALGPALFAVRAHRTSELESTYDRALALCAEVGQEPGFEILWGSTSLLADQGDLLRSLPLAQKMLRMSESTAEAADLHAGHHSVGTTRLYLGEPGKARRHFEAAIALEVPAGGPDLIRKFGLDLSKMHRAHLALSLWLLGYPDQALERCLQAIAGARRNRHPVTLASILFVAGLLFAFRRERKPLAEIVEELRDLAGEYGILFFARPVRIFAAVSELLGGGKVGRRACDRLRRELSPENGNVKGPEIFQTFYKARLCEALLSFGDLAGVRPLLVEAFDVLERGERFWLSELQRLRGDLALAETAAEGKRPASPAEELYGEALATARRQGAKSLELRAAVSLARAGLAAGRPGSAKETLASVYDTFTEGFATADLRGARSLLEELS